MLKIRRPLGRLIFSMGIAIPGKTDFLIETAPWAPSQYPKRRLSVRSRKVSKPRDLYFESSDRSEIWQALRQQCCRCACQISKRYDNLKYQSRGFETLRDLTKRRLFGYWDGALIREADFTLLEQRFCNTWPITMEKITANSVQFNFKLVLTSTKYIFEPWDVIRSDSQWQKCSYKKRMEL